MAGADLSQYLSRAARAEFSWSAYHCLYFVADWAVELTGCDPAAAFRGGHSTEREARRVLRAAGGPVALVGRCLGTSGWARASHPGRGDVGLVSGLLRVGTRRGVYVPVGAICVGGDMWAVKPADGGLVVGRPRVLMAWAHGA